MEAECSVYWGVSPGDHYSDGSRVLCSLRRVTWWSLQWWMQSVVITEACHLVTIAVMEAECSVHWGVSPGDLCSDGRRVFCLLRRVTWWSLQWWTQSVMFTEACHLVIIAVMDAECYVHWGVSPGDHCSDGSRVFCSLRRVTWWSLQWWKQCSVHWGVSPSDHCSDGSRVLCSLRHVTWWSLQWWTQSVLFTEACHLAIIAVMEAECSVHWGVSPGDHCSDGSSVLFTEACHLVIIAMMEVVFCSLRHVTWWSLQWWKQCSVHWGVSPGDHCSDGSSVLFTEACHLVIIAVMEVVFCSLRHVTWWSLQWWKQCSVHWGVSPGDHCSDGSSVLFTEACHLVIIAVMEAECSVHWGMSPGNHCSDGRRVFCSLRRVTWWSLQWWKQSVLFTEACHLAIIAVMDAECSVHWGVSPGDHCSDGSRVFCSLRRVTWWSLQWWKQSALFTEACHLVIIALMDAECYVHWGVSPGDHCSDGSRVFCSLRRVTWRSLQWWKQSVLFTEACHLVIMAETDSLDAGILLLHLNYLKFVSCSELHIS